VTSALRCATCGTEETRSESRFCRACGAPLARPSTAARSVDVGRAPRSATQVAAPVAVPKTIPEREAPRRVAPTRVDPVPSSHGSSPVPYRLSPAPPAASYDDALAPEPQPAPTEGLSLGGLLVRTLVAITLSVGALLASDQLFEAVKKPAGLWVGETFSQDRATSRAIVGGGIAVTATLLVTMTVLLVSTRRRG